MFCQYNHEFQRLLIEKSAQLKQIGIKDKLALFKRGLGADLYDFFDTPFIFPQEDFESLSQGSQRILEAQTHIVNQMNEQLSQQEILDYFLIPNAVRPFIQWDRLLSGKHTVARLDIVPHSKGYSVCEINLHTGVGGMTCGHAYDLTMESLGLQSYYAHGKVSPYLTLAQEIKEIAHHKGYERLVILDWQSHADKGYPSFELMQLSFIQAGIDLPIVTHTEQTFPTQWLAPEDAAKTLVYRGFSLDEVDPNDAFLQSLFTSQATVLHGFEDELRTNKRWLALMWDPAYQSCLTLEQKAAIQTYLPYSCILSQTNLPHFLSHKDDYIFKANEGFGGQGILIGKTLSQQALKKRLESIGIENILAQAFMETDSLSILHDTEEAPAEHKFVLGLYLMGNRSQGLAVRGSMMSDVVNVSSGMAKTGWAGVINETQKAGLVEALKAL